SENFAALHHKGPGDTIEIRGRDGRPITLEVLGTIVDYTWNRGTLLVDRSWFLSEFRDRRVDFYDLFLAEGADAQQVKRTIERRWGEEDALSVMTRPEVHAGLRAQLRRVYSLAYAQQMIVGMVALLGVVSALFISVLQRRRQLGLMRAVGASRLQVL